MTEVEYLKNLIGVISPKLLEHAENDMYGQKAAHGRIYQTFDQYGEVDFEKDYGIVRTKQ